MERISERDAGSKYVVGVELLIVLDMVVANFGAHKKVPPHVIANAGAQIFHEVIGAGEVDATDGWAIAGAAEAVEARTGDTDSAQKVEANFFGNARLEKDVETAQKGTVSFTVIRIGSLVIPPGHIELKAKMTLAADDVRAHVQISAAFLARRLEGHQVAGSGSGE